MNFHLADAQKTELSRLRKQIDEIDQELVRVLARRFRVTEEVGQFKAANRLNAVDEARESMQRARLQQLAVQHSVSPELVNTIFRAIVQQVVANHHAVASQPTSGRSPT